LSTFDRDRPAAHVLLGELTWLEADGRQPRSSRPQRLHPLLVSRFALVGVSGLVVNQALLWLAVAAGHLHYVAGAVLATQGSTTWNFLLLDRWVFPERQQRPGPLRYLAFSGVNNLALLLRVPMLAVLVSLLHVHYLASNLITLVVLFVCRFVVSDRLIWKAPPDAAAPAAPATGAPQARPGRRPAPAREPPTRVHRYDVAGVVALESEVALPELGGFATAALERPADIAISVGAVGRGLRLRPLVTHGPKFVAYEEHLGPTAANFRLDFGDRIDVTVGPLLARSPHVVYTNVVEALLRFVLVSRDHILLHSATIQLGGRGVMLTARTDTGKTGTVLRLLRDHEGAFLSDDMTIVAPSGLALGYPKPLTISSHTLAAVDLGVLSPGEQLKLSVQSRVHSRNGRSIGSLLGQLNLPIMALNAVAQAVVPPPKYMIDRLVPCRFAPSTTVHELFVLERGPAALEELDGEHAAEIMIHNTDDAYGFPPFRYFAPAITIDGQDYRALRRREGDLLARFLRQVRTRRLAREDFSWADTIPRLVADDEGLAPRWSS
jgi:dolichol-phosphate mannosyltransferase